MHHPSNHDSIHIKSVYKIYFLYGVFGKFGFILENILKFYLFCFAWCMDDRMSKGSRPIGRGPFGGVLEPL